MAQHLMTDANDFFSVVFNEQRRDTFPKQKRPVVAATLKHCSYSDSNAAQHWGQCDWSLEDLKRETLDAPNTIKLKVRRNAPLGRSFNAAKKHVVFADDLGYQLTSVKLFNKPSDEPLQSEKFKALWKAAFCKPYLNFVQFLEKLNSQCVALENFSVDTTTETLSGSVKVKNISFEKQVTLRATDNCWATYRDYPATYRADQHSEVYDTFTFEIPLINPYELVSRVEICIRYTIAGREYWDNNGGQNYVLAKELSQYQRNSEMSDKMAEMRLKRAPEVPKLRSIRNTHITGRLSCGPVQPQFMLNYSATDPTKLVCR